MSEPTDIDRSLDAAQLAANRGDFVQAEQLLLEVLAQDAACLFALDLLGFVQFFQGRPEAGEQACRRALALDPGRAYANKGLGLCLAKQGKLDEGLPYLRAAIELEPGWFDPRWDTAVVLAEAGRFEAALAVIEEAIVQLANGVPNYGERLRQLKEEILARSGSVAATPVVPG